MTNKESLKVIVKLLENRDLLEQIAEECSELAHASLKLIRAEAYSNNPTPVTLEDALTDFNEEIDDMLLVLSIIRPELSPIVEHNPKWERWANRLLEAEA